ncbi:hypothetical protein [Desulfopila aestuarii]|uniref:Uncharacterized protein n=1 Tax=Desulfopila aestuarii DSM 18488 TaxID=1121416 RepID=A0A1M7YAE6_9BACT|nr:hypothetical protein [Desulfopila aestuarii]SHO49508.1 hypothetical protein SAMN02745220_02870 [Desulfopila aestuarii DSM 18488]
MSTVSQEEKSFIFELHNMIGGNVDSQVSMYDVGASLGMNKGTTTSMSQDLMIEELVELKTLAGGIGITDKGLELLRKEGLIVGSATEQSIRLGKGPVLDGQDREQVEKFLTEIKKGLFTNPTGYPQIEELVMDVKTLETQMLSPRPKTAVIRAVFSSLSPALAASGSKDISEKIDIFLE